MDPLFQIISTFKAKTPSYQNKISVLPSGEMQTCNKYQEIVNNTQNTLS